MALSQPTEKYPLHKDSDEESVWNESENDTIKPYGQALKLIKNLKCFAKHRGDYMELDMASRLKIHYKNCV